MTKSLKKITSKFKGSYQKLALNKAFVIWIFGLPSSGKTTLSLALAEKLTTLNILNTVLDGDLLRQGINDDLYFSDLDRKENIRRAAHIAKLFTNSNVITICSFITPKKEHIDLVKSIVGVDLLYDIFLECPIEICIERDVKGLYKKAKQGIISNFTGIDGRFENPVTPWLTVNTFDLTEEDCVAEIFDKIFRDLYRE